MGVHKKQPPHYYEGELFPLRLTSSDSSSLCFFWAAADLAAMDMESSSGMWLVGVVLGMASESSDSLKASNIL